MGIYLSPNAKQKFFTSNGIPLAGGKLYSYAAGTTTPAITYTDKNSGINANPVILDANGECNLWLSDSITYKFILKDSSDVTQWTVDNITSGGSSTSSSSTVSSDVNFITGSDGSAGNIFTAYSLNEAVSFQTSGNTVTLTNHGLPNNQVISFLTIVSTTGILTNTAYYVVNSTTNTFQVASTSGGAALTLTTNGTGTMVRSRPSNIVGGSPTISSSVVTTAPLAGLQSLALTKPVGNAQGQGWTVPFSVDLAYRAKSVQIEMDYILNSGAFSAQSTSGESDLIAYIYDATNLTFIQPSSFSFLSNSSTISDKFIANFQTSSNSSSYFLVLHVATVANSAWELKVDNVLVKPSKYVFGTPITSGQPYTPIFTAMGTVTGTSFEYWRVGDRLRARGRFTMGTGTASQAQMSLPLNLTIDGNKLTNIQLVGMAGYSPAFARTMYVIGEPSTSYVTFSDQTNGLFVQKTGASLASNTEIISLEFEVPITGWSSSVQVSDSFDGRQIAATYRTSADVTIGTSNADIIWNTKIDDGAAMMNTLTGVGTAPSSGKYSFNLTGRHDTGASVPGEVQYALIVTGKNAGTYIIWDFNNFTASKIYPVSGLIDLEMNAGDTFKINAVSVTNASTLKGGSSLYSAFSIKKLQASTTISLTERVAFSVNTSTTAATSSTPFIYTVVDTNTHGDYSTITGKFTAKYPGFYIFGSTSYIAATSTPGLYKNGAFVADGMQMTASTVGRTQHGLSLIAGDTIEVRPNSSGTATGTAGQNNFYGFLVK